MHLRPIRFCTVPPNCYILPMLEENPEIERDHKRLGRELDLFTFSDEVGKGLPLWLPKGATVRRELERWIVDEELKRGYGKK